MKKLTDMTNEELWAIFPIVLSEHQPGWAADYETEHRRLVHSIGKEQIVRINHIGSTSVTDLLAKPTIDILLEIKKSVDTVRLIQILESLGYIYTYQPHNPAPHMMLMKGYTPEGFAEKVYHLHVRYLGDWDELYFRDYLEAHPEVRYQYASLKRQLQMQFEHDRDAYTDAKTSYIMEMSERGRLEFPDRYMSFDTNFHKRLSAKISMDDIYEIIYLLQGNEKRKNDLYHLLYDEDAKIAYQVAWVLSHLSRSENEWLYDKQHALIDESMKCAHEGKRRLLLTLLYRQPLETPPRVDFLDFCFAQMMDANVSIAVRALSMKIAYELCLPIPELLEEMKAMLEMLDEQTLSSGLCATRRNILKAMHTRTSLQDL